MKIKFVKPFATTFIDPSYNCVHLCSICKHNCIEDRFLATTKCVLGEKNRSETVKECSSFIYGV